MRIALDASSAAKEGGTGIPVYIRTLTAALGAVDKKNKYVLCYRVSRIKNRKHFIKLPGENFSQKIIQEPFNVLFPKTVEVFHGPDARLPSFRGPSLVATIHDLFSLVSDEFADADFREKKKKRYADIAKRAAVIIVPSGHTKKDVLERLEVEEERVAVVHHGVSPAFRPLEGDTVRDILSRYGIRGKYVLYVGNVSTRKNVDGLINAFAASGLQDEEWSLVIAGGDGYGARGAHEAAGYLGDAVKFIGHVDASDLPALFSGAGVFSLLSLYEGFGMPVLEAMASGVPVVASNATSLPEVAGDAAVLVDAENVEETADALRRTASDGELRAELIEKGKIRAAEFTWEKAARKTLDAYEKAIKG